MKRQWLKKILILFLSVCFVFSATLSFGKEKQPHKPVKLKVTILPYISYAPLLIAQEEGYFADQGLEIEVVKFSRSPEAIPALVQGRLDAAGSFMSV